MPLNRRNSARTGWYLWHLPVLLTFHDLPWFGPERSLPNVICLTLTLTLALALAMCSWHFYEKPFAKRWDVSAPPQDLRAVKSG